MRKLFTTIDAAARGVSIDALKWGVRCGRYQRVMRGVYIEGPELPTALDRALALVVVTGGAACGSLAGYLYELDSIVACKPFVTVPISNHTERPGVRHMELTTTVDVQGYRCTDGLQTMLDLALILDDLRWEQTLESALRKRIVTVEQIEQSLRRRRVGNARIRRVLRRRPDGVPPTESLLETLMVQLIRTDPALPEPSRQVEVRNQYDKFVARVDLAWPDFGVFIELDGQQHKDQPVYDARRETAVVAATGWLPARFTWDEVVRNKRSTLRRLVDIYARGIDHTSRRAG